MGFADWQFCRALTTRCPQSNVKGIVRVLVFAVHIHSLPITAAVMYLNPSWKKFVVAYANIGAGVQWLTRHKRPTKRLLIAFLDRRKLNFIGPGWSSRLRNYGVWCHG